MVLVYVVCAIGSNRRLAGHEISVMATAVFEHEVNEIALHDVGWLSGVEISMGEEALLGFRPDAGVWLETGGLGYDAGFIGSNACFFALIVDYSAYNRLRILLVVV